MLTGGLESAAVLLGAAGHPAKQRISWELLFIDDFMSRLLPLRETPGGTGYAVDTVVLVSLLVSVHLNAGLAVKLDGQQVPLLFRDDFGQLCVRIRFMADGYSSKTGNCRGVSGVLGLIAPGVEHIWNNPEELFKYLQQAGQESKGNYRDNAHVATDELLGLQHAAVLAVVGDAHVYQVKINLMFCRDLSLMWTETAMGKCHKVCLFVSVTN
jgi:hypothetical protein